MAGLTLTAQAGNPDTEGIVKVNTTTSKIEWTAKKVTGKHNGSVNIKSGSLKINDGVLTGGSFTIDMESIKVLDLQGESAGKLERHLKSDDFFSVATHTTAKLEIIQVAPKGNGAYAVSANLTIKGITHPVNFTTTVTPLGKKYQAKANIVVDRSLYDVKYGSGKFFDNLGDKTIYDEFDLVVSLVTE
jgi:polyisoprenoid-binding protein YceI